jgi:anthranilate/para-aminobenzoate synthase component II
VIVSTVDAIVDRRNQIAHGKADATITLTDAHLYDGATSSLKGRVEFSAARLYPNLRVDDDLATPLL